MEVFLVVITFELKGAETIAHTHTPTHTPTYRSMFVLPHLFRRLLVLPLLIHNTQEILILNWL